MTTYNDLKDFRDCGGMMRHKDASPTNPSPVLSAADVYRICQEEIGRIRQEIADEIPDDLLHLDTAHAVEILAGHWKFPNR